MAKTLESLEAQIMQKIYSMLQNHTNMWLIIALASEDCDNTILISADKIEEQLTDILWDGYDDNFEIIKNNLDKLLKIKSQYKTTNVFNDGIYMIHWNDITRYMSNDEFAHGDCDCENFMAIINFVYDKLINNVNMYVKVLQEYMTDSKKCDAVDGLLNLMLSLQTIRKIQE